jgi:hypothetical protein
LNQSYEKITYHSAIYWRFLYEQCGGMKLGIEDPTAGMKVIRTTLETLYQAETIDVRRSKNIVKDLPRLMDQVFEKEDSCPFVNYADSLEHFARAIYNLKLEDRRCFKPGIPRECGFYDPNELYPLPPVRTVNLTSASNPITGDVASSYGIDFIDVLVSPNINVRSLTMEFANTPSSDTRFSVQVLKIQILGDDPRQPAYMVQYGQSAVLTEKTSSGSLVYRIDETELDNIDCIGLVITRLDGNEKSETGGYELTFQVQ